jgi:hypothetical protein
MVLTEAFACDRCRRIFVLQEDGLTIEELAATYPYKRRYYWNGSRFQSVRSMSNSTFGRFVSAQDRWAIWLQCLGIIALLLVIFQLYYRVTLTSPILNLVLSIAIPIIVLIVIMLWLFDQG